MNGNAEMESPAVSKLLSYMRYLSRHIAVRIKRYNCCKNTGVSGIIAFTIEKRNAVKRNAKSAIARSSSPPQAVPVDVSLGFVLDWPPDKGPVVQLPFVGMQTVRRWVVAAGNSMTEAEVR